MKTKLGILAMGLIAAGTMFAQPRVAIGIGVGGYGPGYPPPSAYAQQYMPPAPGPDYSWVDGYWGPQGAWVGGYWRAPFVSGYRVAPRYNNSFRGNDRGRFDHERFEHERFEHTRSYSRGFRR